MKKNKQTRLKTLLKNMKNNKNKHPLTSSRVASLQGDHESLSNPKGGFGRPVGGAQQRWVAFFFFFSGGGGGRFFFFVFLMAFKGVFV